jgi:hypothetical protein
MGQRGMWTDWTATVAQRLPSLSQSQAKVLAAFSLGVALTQRCTLRAVAEALARWGKPDTVERRLPPFLTHPRLDWQACLLAFAAWVLRHRETPRVLVWLADETSLQEHVKVIAVSRAYRGRAIPLAWWGYRPAASGMGGGGGKSCPFGISNRPGGSGSAVMCGPWMPPIGCGWCGPRPMPSY